ncbi:MAG: coenzyme F420-0:L-glutamate ligase [Candidatus Gracilibacteria bacterium]|nr:coenzyme F420-0:L-glutamate ligase [Candidatus Gracilibacteria bacterium]MDD5179243.1 coenzyme F420-0:L-glutamate ligase [Candidatus Gracilibacteria bacterium]
MELIPLKTPLIKPKDNLLEIFEIALKKARKTPCDGDIWVISSKVVALMQNRIVTLSNQLTEADLSKKEADIWLGGKPYPFAVKDGILTPRAGIDASNIEAGKRILWPKNSWKVAEDLRKAVMQKLKLKQFGVEIIDSICHPLRFGVIGIALSWSGFEGVEDFRNRKDLFGNKLKVTRKAVADQLASAASLITGEAAESTPFVLVRNAPVKFTTKTVKPRKFQPKDCLFAPIYNSKFRNLKI